MIVATEIVIPLQLNRSDIITLKNDCTTVGPPLPLLPWSASFTKQARGTSPKMIKQKHDWGVESNSLSKQDLSLNNDASGHIDQPLEDMLWKRSRCILWLKAPPNFETLKPQLFESASDWRRWRAQWRTHRTKTENTQSGNTHKSALGIAVAVQCWLRVLPSWCCASGWFAKWLHWFWLYEKAVWWWTFLPLIMSTVSTECIVTIVCICTVSVWPYWCWWFQQHTSLARLQIAQWKIYRIWSNRIHPCPRSTPAFQKHTSLARLQMAYLTWSNRIYPCPKSAQAFQKHTSLARLQMAQWKKYLIWNNTIHPCPRRTAPGAFFAMGLPGLPGVPWLAMSSLPP